MRPTYYKFLLSALVLLFSRASFSQTCTGSLGDPVINETFGVGATYGIGPALPGAVTNYNYTNSNCPGDGYYTIATSVGNCFNAWDIVPHDHTGETNGYMMVVNSSYEPGIFYTQRAGGALLCPNTTYEFAAWILNLIRGVGRPEIKPNITFIIETASGVELKRYETGDIPSEATAAFHQYGTFFTTPSNGEDIVVKMINNAPGGNGNDLVLDDITFRPCGPVILAGFGDVNATADRDLCEGENASYVLKAQQTGYANPYYQWQINKNDGAGWRDISGETTKEYTVSLTDAAAGKYQYRIGVLDGPNASLVCRIYSQPLNINVNALPVIRLQNAFIVCDGAELRLTASGGDKYHWTGPNAFVSDEQSPVLSYNATNSLNGVYSLTVTTKDCSSQASTTVSVLPPVSPTVSSDVTICAGESTQLVAGGGVYYKWTPSTGLDHDDVANPVASPLETTLYHVRVDNGGCADETKTILVTVQARPFADAGPDVAIQEGETTQLAGKVAGDNVNYYWTDGTALSNTTLMPIVNPIENTTYTLHVESLGDCGTATDQVFVRVYRKLTIPSAFSPNNDGVNDLWNIDKLITYPEAVLTVYNRAGLEVYRTVGYAKPWDGTFGGAMLPAGTYYYVLDLKNGTLVRTGWVLLVR